MIKKIILSLVVIGVAIGLFFFGRYQIKLYNTIIVQNNKINLIDDFLSQNFPNEIQKYIADLKALQTK